MSASILLSVALRATVILAVTLLVLPLLARRSAVLRRLVTLLGLSAVLVLPLLVAPFPGRPALRVVPAPDAARIYAERWVEGDAPRAVSPAPVLGRSRAADFSWTAAVLTIWLVGTTLLLLRLGLGLVRARALLRRSERFADGIGISGDVVSPVAVGLFAPAILLPAASTGWSDERRRAVLLHESAHVRRRDGLALLVAQLACALYWFNPLAWLAARRLRRECELSADEDVIANGVRPSTYAEHLLAIAAASGVPASGVAMVARLSELGRRVHTLLGRDRSPAPPTRLTALLCCGAAALVLAAAACAEAASDGGVPARTPDAAGIDAVLQGIVQDEAARAQRDFAASRVAIVVLDPGTGKLVAHHDDAPERPIVPASTLKPLVVALALDAGVIDREQRFDCGNGQRAYAGGVLRDAAPHGSLDAAEILARSSNVGMSRIFDALGGERLSSGLERFGAVSVAPPEDGSLAGAVTAIGQRHVTTTPLALARAYGVFASGGVRARHGAANVRVIREETAAALRGMLEHAVSGELATGKAAAVPGVRVAGKTGTSDGGEIFASFAGLLPAERSRYVIYVGVGTSQPEASGATVAAPVFARVASRIASR